MGICVQSCKHYYELLNKNSTVEPTGIKSWKINFADEHSEWENKFSSIYHATRDNKLRQFAFKFLQSCGRPSLTGSIYLCTGIYVQSCGRPSLTGSIYLCTGIYVQNCGRPSLTGLIYLCVGICVQSCGRPSLTGLIYSCAGIYVQSCGLPCLTGVICLFMMIFV